ncbi:MAG: sigma-70 family RNA polymerase sigma factor [Clostridia bacterium]|nr:sigma-70 family RNA polymerase sigma factor [Clostridia bacterium]
MDDKDIIKLYFDRSEKAISKTSEKYGRYLMRIAKNILISHQDSEECVNDTYLKAWNSIPPKTPQSLRAYLGRITRNSAINLCKKRTAEKRGTSVADIIFSELEACIPSELTVEKDIDEKFLISLLEDFLRDQKEKNRNIFVRRYWYCESLSQIAKDLSMKESTVASILYRMRLNLKEKLEKEGLTV